MSSSGTGTMANVIWAGTTAVTTRCVERVLVMREYRNTNPTQQVITNTNSKNPPTESPTARPISTGD